MAAHNHLDRQRRTRGDCPACDIAWERQDARLAGSAEARNVIAQLERMADKPRLTLPQLCRAQKLLRRPENLHTCGLPPNHPGAHWCPLCEQDWT